MSVWNHIAEQISQNTGMEFSPTSPKSVGGGCINQSYCLGDGSRSYFVKLNSRSRSNMFEAEAAGLQEIANSNSIKVPLPVCHGSHDENSYLVMEHITLSSRGDAQQAGRQLALMHRKIGGGHGWKIDNTIGSTHQPNNLKEDWVEFWRENRLGYQLQLASQTGPSHRLIDSGQRLMELLPDIIGHKPMPSLLHGDLWGGNIGYDPEGRPVVFDPAVYFGDREADLAMTELFGGFNRDFYAAYDEEWPIDPGYRDRRDLYNLYHILNHMNIFGGGYAGQAQAMIDRLLSILRG